MTEERAKLYRTATSAIACAKFKAGDIVAVRFSGIGINGVKWFRVARDPSKADAWTVYPEHHLTRFVL